ncbi:MAG: hypothetical protein RLZZ461_1696 [Planctomycetota bacterium]|jgi:hypothetical protein
MAVSIPATAITPPPSPPPRIVVDRDDLVVDRDCVLVAAPTPVADAANDGVVRIVGDDITVSIEGAIRGAAEDLPPDRRAGIGIVILGDRVVLRGGGVHGFRVGVEVRDAEDVVIEDLDASHQFAQRLGSTPEREDPADWLWPHENDDGQWATRYGASVRVVGAARPTLQRIRVRGSQNGIMLERVSDAIVIDCDCSFLSGWGLAMWRTSGSRINRNAFDFCVRGYSHGVYNRGQDSAGILMFEQCVRNKVFENSCTHGGDGIFGFGGREALGQVPPEEPVDAEWYHRRGNSGNLFLGNDLSDAVAHGFEMTFSHGWILESNRLHRNGICGVWAGYSSHAVIRGNDFADNGSMAYGREGGGVNIEHGVGNRVLGNRFVRDSEGIELWWDEDQSLLATPWAKANDVRSAENVIADNRFENCGTAVDLRRTDDTVIERNVMTGPGVGIVLENAENTAIRSNLIECAEPVRGGDLLDNGEPVPPIEFTLGPGPVPGRNRPVDARRALAGRDRIVMTEWGPYDWSHPMLRQETTGTASHEWRLLGPLPIARVEIDGAATATRGELLDRIIVQPAPADDDVPGFIRYRLLVVPEGADPIEVEGRFPQTRWEITSFATSADPREDPGAWVRDRLAARLRWTAPELDLVYAMGGPTDLAPADAVIEDGGPLPGRERFGTIARASLRLPPGRYRLRILSDDGVRATLDGRRIIDNWTWHPPSEDAAEFEIIETRTVELVVEHFELDGYSVLRADLEPID